MAGKASFNALKKLAPKKRMELARSDVGPSLLSLLTPAQMAELFPDYYRRGLPDVSGFREAVSRQTQQQQKQYEQTVADKLGIDPKTGRTKGGWMEKMGEKYGSTASTGSLSQNQREAYKAARTEGLSDKAAKILVANMSGESLKNPSDHHWDRTHMSQGIVQWDPQRAERIKNHFGSYPKDMSVAEQTKATVWEMKTYYSKSWQDLNNENLSDSQRLTTVVSDYERPKDVAGAVSNRMNYYNGLKVEEEVKSSDVSRSSAGTGGHYGESEQCVGLSKHFAPQVGAASKWRVNFNPGGIKPGTVIATMSYNDGSGGKMAKDMPDDKSHYHTGIALSAPDANGNVLIMDQSAGRGSAVHMVNINDYHGEKWGIVEGGEPTERTLQAVDVGKKLADKSQLAMIEGNAVTVSTKQAAPPPPGPVADREAPDQPARDPGKEPARQDAKGVKKEDLTATVEQRGQEPPTAPTKKEKTFVLTKEAFLSEIEKKHPEAAVFGYTREHNWNETIKGFQESGVPFKITKNGIELTVDPSDPRYVDAVQEMKSQGLDQSVFISQKKEEEKKQEAQVKAKETAPQAPTAPEKPKHVADNTPAQERPKTTQETPPPPAYAGAGKEKFKGSLSFAPITPRRGDDMMVTDSSGKQFTMNKKETASIDPNSDTVKIDHRSDLGFASEKFESGGRGVHTISSGKKDPGGVSYGSHQLSAREGTMARYLASSEGQAYAAGFKGLKPGTSAFNRIYDKVADNDPEGFRKSQESFITRTHYEPVYKHAKKLGYNVDDPRVQEALYSMSVQHGGAKKIITAAKASATASPEQQVSGLFDARRAYVARHHQNFNRRYGEEQRNILAMDTSKYQQAGGTQVASVKPGRTPPGIGTETTPGTGQLPTQQLAMRAKPESAYEKVKREVLGQSPAVAGTVSPAQTPAAEKVGPQPGRPDESSMRRFLESQAAAVTPSQRVGSVGATPNTTQGELQNIRTRMDQMQQNVGQAEQKPPNEHREVPPNSNPDFMNNMLSQRDKPYFNPTMERAMQRSVAGTETDSMHGHYSWGNK